MRSANSFGNALGNSIVGAIEAPDTTPHFQFDNSQVPGNSLNSLDQINQNGAFSLPGGALSTDDFSGLSLPPLSADGLSTPGFVPQLGGASGVSISGQSSAPQLIDDGGNGLQEVGAGEGSLTYEYGTDANGIPEITTTYHEGLDDRLADAQNFLTQSQQASEDSAFGAGIAGFTRFGVGVGVAALNIPRLITSPDLVPGLVNAALHPINTISNAATGFINAPLDQKGLDVVNFLAFGGGDKLLASAGDFAVQGGKAAASFAGDVAAGQFGLQPLFLTDGVGASIGLGGVTGIQNPIVRVARPTPLFTSDRLQIPFGFSGEGDFLAFSAALRAGLPEGVEPVFQGSSVTGVKGVSSNGIAAGTPFDMGRVSDFDIGLISEDLATNASLMDGVRIKTDPTRIGPISPGSDLGQALGLSNLGQTLSLQAGRPVNFLIYDSLEGAYSQPSIYVPGGQ